MGSIALKLTGAQIFILYHLDRHKYYGHRHCPKDSVTKGLPATHRGVGKVALKGLIKLQIVLEKPTGYGDQVFLNLKAKAIIDAAADIYADAAGAVDLDLEYEIVIRSSG